MDSDCDNQASPDQAERRCYRGQERRVRLQRAVEHHRKNDQNRTKHHVYDGIPEQKNRLPFKKKLKLLN